MPTPNAVSRITRTPIYYDTNYENAGAFNPSSGILQNILAMLGRHKPGITINPNNTNDLRQTINHEDIHSLLSNMNENGQLENLNKVNPFYSKIASLYESKYPGKNTNSEIPALSAAGEGQTYGIPQPLTQQYNDYLRNQLFKLDPKLAAKYAQLSKGVTQ